MTRCYKRSVGESISSLDHRWLILSRFVCRIYLAIYMATLQVFHLLKVHPYWGTFWGFDPQDIITKPIIPLNAIKFGDNPPMDQLKHKKMPWDTLMKSSPAIIGQIKFSSVPLYLVELLPQMPNNKHDTPWTNHIFNILPSGPINFWCFYPIDVMVQKTPKDAIIFLSRGVPSLNGIAQYYKPRDVDHCSYRSVGGQWQSGAHSAS